VARGLHSGLAPVCTGISGVRGTRPWGAGGGHGPGAPRSGSRGVARLGSRISDLSIYGDFSSGTESPTLPGELLGERGRPGGRAGPGGAAGSFSPGEPPCFDPPRALEEPPWLSGPHGRSAPGGPPMQGDPPTLCHGAGGVCPGCWAGVPNPSASRGRGGPLSCPRLHAGMRELAGFPSICSGAASSMAVRDPPGSSPPSRLIFISPFGGFHLPSDFFFSPSLLLEPLFMQR